jgi:hypothetical protein
MRTGLHDPVAGMLSSAELIKILRTAGKTKAKV